MGQHLQIGQKKNLQKNLLIMVIKKRLQVSTKNIRMRHISENKILNYTSEDLLHLKTLGLDTGANPEDIKKAYKVLVKHCHPDQNPDLENGTYIFNRINEAYNALKDKDFS